MQKQAERAEKAVDSEEKAELDKPDLPARVRRRVKIRLLNGKPTPADASGKLNSRRFDQVSLAVLPFQQREARAPTIRSEQY